MKKSFLILVSLYIIAFGNTFANQNVVTGDSAVAEIIHPENTSSDGPYIYRHSDSMAIVLYFCDGAVTTDSFSVIDTLKFRGLCADSLNEYIIPFVVNSVPPAEYQNVSKIFAISDIHGEYEMMVDILRNGGVIDDKLLWTWGDGHLVVDGDVFDRGDMVTESLADLPAGTGSRRIARRRSFYSRQS